MVRFLVVAFIFFIPIWANAQYEFNTYNRKAYNSLLKLKIQEAERYLEKSKAYKQKNGIDLYIANLSDITQLIITEDTKLYEKLKDNEDKRLDALNELDQKSAYYNFIKAEIKMQWSVVKLKFGKQNAAILGCMGAYNLLKKNEKKFPDFVPHKKTLGAAKVLLGAMPAKLQKLTSIIGYKGDINQGFKDVQSVIDSKSHFSLEAKLTRAWLQSYVLGESDKAFEQMKTLANQHADNLLIHVSCAIIGRHAGRAREAYQILKKAPKGNEYFNFYFLEYIRSELALQMGSYYASIAHAKSFVKNYTGKNYVKAAYMRIFLAYWFLDDSRASQFFEKAKSNGQTMVVPDEYASKFLEEELPHKQITQARFYTDGGELVKATVILNKIDVEKLPRKRDQLEYYYRRARILHKEKKYKEAVAKYKSVLALTKKDSPYYFGANTALQLGFIYRDVFKDYKSSEYYFKEALSYTGHEYESGIDSKAKAGINSIKSLKEN